MSAISVVIATFNRAHLLRETLQSLLVQRFEPGDEVIVVDNASTDGTAGVVREFSRIFPAPLRLRREQSPGKTPALIHGLAAAHGDVMALTDDDVLVAEDWIEAIRRAFADPTLGLIGGRVDPRWEQSPPGWLRIEGDGRYTRMCAPLALLHYGSARQPLGSRTAVGANMAVRADVLRALGGFASHLGRRRGTLLGGEDHELCQRAVAAGYRCEYHPDVRVRHWVPSARVRLSYYLRWFFWCGITHAVVETQEHGRDSRAVRPVLYWVREAIVAAGKAGALALTARPAAAERATDSAFALGRLAYRLRYLAHVRRATERSPVPALGSSNPGVSSE
ncbi:MAG TPA: glycosyltransferase family 2 protein [Vicinamibacterales bacterium]|nr:glycosyltransferase family 2 protein [Vicinamibacterales bacterium]